MNDELADRWDSGELNSVEYKSIDGRTALESSKLTDYFVLGQAAQVNNELRTDLAEAGHAFGLNDSDEWNQNLADVTRLFKEFLSEFGEKQTVMLACLSTRTHYKTKMKQQAAVSVTQKTVFTPKCDTKHLASYRLSLPMLNSCLCLGGLEFAEEPGSSHKRNWFYSIAVGRDPYWLNKQQRRSENWYCLTRPKLHPEVPISSQIVSRALGSREEFVRTPIVAMNVIDGDHVMTLCADIDQDGRLAMLRSSTVPKETHISATSERHLILKALDDA